MANLRYLSNSRTGEPGTLVEMSTPLQFGDDDSYIKATAAGALKIVGGTSLTLEATTITLNGAFTLSGTDTLNLGTSGTPLTLTAGTPVMTVYTTCAGAVGTVAQPILFNTVLTGAGQLGGRVRVNMATEVTLGSYANAFKASVDLGTNGGVTGLLSVVCAEMTMATANISGTYAIEEWEMTYAATGSGSLPKPCFVYANSNGTARTVFDDYGDFIIFGTGFTAATGHMFGAGTSTIRLGTGALGATKRYIPLSTAEASYTSAYPIVLTYTTAAAIQIGTTGKVQFRDTALYINSSTDGQLDIVADSLVQVTGKFKVAVGTIATTGNAIYTSYTCSATSGNIYGHRLFISGTGVSTGGIRGIRCEADAGDTASASLLEAGLFTAKVSSGSATVTNIRALSGHVSIGASLTVSGDVVCINGHMQTRSDENITGVHTTLYLKNEAVGGNGLTLDSAVHVTEASLGGGEKGYGVLIDCSTATLDVHDTDRVTLIKFKDAGGTVRKLVFDVTNNTVVAVQT